MAACALALLAFAPMRARAAAAPASDRHHLEARALVARAEARLARRTIEMRRMAIADLERASELEPGDPATELLLARTYLQAGFLKLARRRFESLARLAPDDAEARYGIAQVWRRDYLKYLDTLSLARAVDHLRAATTLEPRLTDGWLMRSSLAVEQHDLAGALDAARGAYEAEPGRGDALLALGSARWRLGDVDGADSCFRAALPRLRRNVRERFDDFSPVASEKDTSVYNHLPESQQPDFARRFWTEHDPDLTTPQNEAQLEYFARVAQAYFLFYDPKHREWDERGEVYVRYGPPERATYNPLGAMLYSTVSQNSQFLYPANVLQWEYPKLGMSVTLQDRVLTEYYQLPISFDHDPDPRPDPVALAKLDAVGTHDLRGVFPTLPPGAKPLPLTPQVATFASERGGRVFSAVEVAASPSDTLWAEAVVLDSTQREVSRGGRSLSPSACEPDRFRIADFASDLPPGRYLVGLSVKGGGRRGSVRVPVRIAPPDTTLALSDLAVTCGAPDIAAQAVRLDADPRAIVTGDDPLTAYFEIRNLATGDDGQARFEYVYRVRSAEKDPRIWLQRALQPRAASPSLEMSRDESNTGGLRRQYVSIPVRSLPSGRWTLEVKVTDLLTGAEAARSVGFTRFEGPEKP